jgi:hypothetical protein
MQKHNQLNEGLQADDLKYLVDNTIHIDEYNSKMGDPSDVVTLSFKVKDLMPATDLVSFLENGYDFILDADVSTGEVADNERLVFVEVQRRPNVYKYVNEMLDDLNHLTGVKRGDWKFRWYKSNDYQPMNEENFTKSVPQNPAQYEESIKSYQRVKNDTEKLNSDIEAIKKLSGLS